MAANPIVLNILQKLARPDRLGLTAATWQESYKDSCFLKDSAEKEKLSQWYKNLNSLDEYFDFAVNVLGPHQIKSEIIGFLNFARNRNPKVICEIGTAFGGTNFLLRETLPSADTMIGLDLLVQNKAKLNYFHRPGCKSHYINGDSTDETVINQVESILGGRTIDLLFIDGNHEYAGVQSDFLNYQQFVHDGSIVAFHDIVPDYQQLRGENTGHDSGGVPQFWNKIKSRYSIYEFIENREQDAFGIGAIEYLDSESYSLD